ncbi:urea ABC transporter permease subunit UrtC, partial [Comamonas sp. F1-6]
VNSQAMHVLLFALSGLALLGCFLFSRWLVRSKYGRVLQAVRDAESRTMFCGYNPLPYKLSIWVISAMMCGLAGALYVPQVGIINPSEMSVGNSIEMAVWTAVGGRASLVGPIIGAFAVNGGKSWLTVAAPEYWLYVLGALFIVVTLFMPGGLIRLPQQLRQWREKRKAQVKAPLNQAAAAGAKTTAEPASADALEGVRA